MGKLTPKQSFFVVQYLVNMNGKQAARLLTKANIREYIENCPVY